MVEGETNAGRAERRRLKPVVGWANLMSLSHIFYKLLILSKKEKVLAGIGSALGSGLCHHLGSPPLPVRICPVELRRCNKW